MNLRPPGYENMGEPAKKRALPTKSGARSLFLPTRRRRTPAGTLSPALPRLPLDRENHACFGKAPLPAGKLSGKSGSRGAKTREDGMGKIAEKPQNPAIAAPEREKEKCSSLPTKTHISPGRKNGGRPAWVGGHSSILTISTADSRRRFINSFLERFD